jgi:hypothetical protein
MPLLNVTSTEISRVATFRFKANKANHIIIGKNQMIYIELNRLLLYLHIAENLIDNYVKICVEVRSNKMLKIELY